MFIFTGNNVKNIYFKNVYRFWNNECCLIKESLCTYRYFNIMTYVLHKSVVKIKKKIQKYILMINDQLPR